MIGVGRRQRRRLRRADLRRHAGSDRRSRRGGGLRHGLLPARRRTPACRTSSTRPTFPAANSLLRSTAHLTTVVGTLIGGAVVAAASPDVCYAVNAVSFAGSALLLATIPCGRMRAPEHRSEGGLSRRGTGRVLARLPLAGAARRVHLVEPRHARERRRERLRDLPRQGLVRRGQLRLRRSCGREPASGRSAAPCTRVRGSSGAACPSSTAPAWR